MISRLAFACLWASALCSAARVPTYFIDGANPSHRAWEKIFTSVGLSSAPENEATVLVSSSTPGGAESSDRIVIVQGDCFAAKDKKLVSVRHIVDEHAPGVPILWQQPMDIAPPSLPSGFHVYATDRWTNTPVLAGKRTAHGAILWLASPPGDSGYERYPYLLQALVDLGLNLPAQATDVWAFFDGPYRVRADIDYLARRWRAAGISVLHVAAWHNMEDDPAQDAFLAKVIEACHRNAILVYAWLELPHVSEKFWADHPEWREKTAAGQDAQLDWRKLMNLQNPACHDAVAKQVRRLLDRFDWDGVNLAELYFESLEGAANPARFTPMNDNVRAEYKEIAGIDPKQLFDAPAQEHELKQFLQFRAVLAARMQANWLKEMDAARSTKPYLDVVLTHIDDRFDPAIRDELGADVARSLPVIQKKQSTLLVEDPANLWSLGPERYSKLAAKYRELTPNLKDVGVDINVVERYQDVYPTKKQTGVELFELVHEASASFGHVALYFENSIERQDLPLLPFAASKAHVTEQGQTLQTTAPVMTRILAQAPVAVDGRAWPVQNEHFALVPAGTRKISDTGQRPAIILADFNGDIRSAFADSKSSEISYVSKTRAIALLGSAVSTIEMDGAPFWKTADHLGEKSVLLPAGQHIVTFRR